jgi:hypothetical protein
VACDRALRISEQLLEMALPASAIGLRLKALDANTGHDVAQFGQPLDVFSVSVTP